MIKHIQHLFHRLHEIAVMVYVTKFVTEIVTTGFIA